MTANVIKQCVQHTRHAKHVLITSHWEIERRKKPTQALDTMVFMINKWPQPTLWTTSAYAKRTTTEELHFYYVWPKFFSRLIVTFALKIQFSLEMKLKPQYWPMMRVREILFVKRLWWNHEPNNGRDKS